MGIYVIFLLFLLKANAEEEGSADEAIEDIYVLDLANKIAFMSVAFILALSASISGVTLGYYFRKDDHMMQEYLSYGVVEKGEILSYDRKRGGRNTHQKNKGEAEYIAVVQYEQTIHSEYMIRICKEMTIMSGDIIVPKQPSNHPPYIEVFVLPEEPRSGFPKRHVERSCSCGRKLFLILIVTVNALIAFLCIEAASFAFYDGRTDRGHLFVIAFLFILHLFELLMIHCLFGSIFTKSLNDYYFESARYVSPQSEDNSSITSITSGDDAYLFQTMKYGIPI